MDRFFPKSAQVFDLRQSRGLVPLQRLKAHENAVASEKPRRNAVSFHRGFFYPKFLPLGFSIFWMIRVRFTGWLKQRDFTRAKQDSGATASRADV